MDASMPGSVRIVPDEALRRCRAAGTNRLPFPLPLIEDEAEDALLPQISAFLFRSSDFLRHPTVISKWRLLENLCIRVQDKANMH
jgi:hypothetical protein